jgi:hypothetical protein
LSLNASLLSLDASKHQVEDRTRLFKASGPR